ncbi:hypothetical protein GAW91_000130 [Vibrio fluvialis]|nr:hypothetical protein [Vibrio fluvialis]
MKGFLFSLLYFALLFIGIGIALYQVYEYFRYGDWVVISVLDFLISVGISWADHPKDWIGAWVVLGKIPLSLALLILGGMMVVSNDK